MILNIRNVQYPNDVSVYQGQFEEKEMFCWWSLRRKAGLELARKSAPTVVVVVSSVLPDFSDEGLLAPGGRHPQRQWLLLCGAGLHPLQDK